MWPDRVSNPGPLTYESGALPTALRGPALVKVIPKCLRQSVCVSTVFIEVEGAVYDYVSVKVVICGKYINLNKITKM